MSSGALRVIAIGCFVLCAILLFVARERHKRNAQAIDTANRIVLAFPVGNKPPATGTMERILGDSKVKSGATSAATLPIVFAALFGVAGVVSLVIAQKKQEPPSRPARR
jgi:hypothetical protein